MCDPEVLNITLRETWRFYFSYLIENVITLNGALLNYNLCKILARTEDT
jgi:hypothetical protein